MRQDVLQLERVEADDSRLFRTTRFDDRLLKHRQSFVQPHKIPQNPAAPASLIGPRAATNSEAIFLFLPILASVAVQSTRVVRLCRCCSNSNDICQRVSDIASIARHLFLLDA